MAIYTGDAFPEWRGSFLIAGLSSKALIRLAVEKDRVVGEERLLTDRGARFREVVIGRGGVVFLLTDEGEILKLQPKSAD